MPIASFPEQYGMDDVEITTKEVVYAGYFKMLKYHFRHKRFSGQWSEVITRELFERGHAVAMLPYDPVQNVVVLIEQIRIGAIAAKTTPWQLEIVAGVIDNDESPPQVAIREAQEEAGLDVKELIPITRYLSSSGGCSEQIHLYLGIVDASAATGVFGLAEEDEDILVHAVPLATALEWLAQGRIENAASIIALQWLALQQANGAQ